QGIAVVAALFGLVGAGVAYVLYGFGLNASGFIGVLVAAIAGIFLLLGWREPAQRHGSQPSAQAATPAKEEPVAAVAEPAPAPEPAPVAAPTPAPAPVAESPQEAAKPEMLTAAREGGPDDLKQIKGVGKKLEQTLHGMGVFHFDQIASWGPNEQAWIDDNLTGFKGRATRDNWVEQAKVLAAGGETEFSKKVEGGDVY
ncbi:MAG: NADH:ubiquinone oxidoreductase, partial [Pseudomonadota bacterium]